MGISPAVALRADPVELAVLADVVKQAAKYADQREESLARRVVYELSEALKRGK